MSLNQILGFIKILNLSFTWLMIFSSQKVQNTEGPL
jgi:hypothetical protein